ncbi:transcriptional elongation regulator miniyo [Fagus crenata]
MTTRILLGRSIRRRTFRARLVTPVTTGNQHWDVNTCSVPLEKCIAKAEGYLEPVEDNVGILEAYLKSWNSGALDRAAT